MACARCGCGVYQTEDIITLNKVWHKCCFTCYKCKKGLDKCTAKIFQGEVFCDCCYKCLLKELELISSPSKPCRVVSSPSCVCEKQQSKFPKVLPPFDGPKKIGVCCGQKQMLKNVKSCSFIPDQKANKTYCFTFPLPREVANYYNRVNSVPKTKQNCCCMEAFRRRPRRADNAGTLKIRSISQQRPCQCCRSPSSPRSPQPCLCQCPPPNNCPPPINCPPPECCCRCCLPQPTFTPPSPQCKCPPCPSSPPRPRCPSPTPQCCPSPPPQCCPSPPSQGCNFPQPERICGCSKCCPPPRCKVHSCPPRPACSKMSRRKQCSPCCPENNRKQEFAKNKSCSCYQEQEEKCPPCVCKCKKPKYDPCGNLSPCSCKICKVRAICTPCCNRCGRKVYAAEKISVSKGAYHTSCFSCFCCRKLLDVKNFYESCGEIYCRQCYNNLYGNQLYGYGASQIC